MFPFLLPVFTTHVRPLVEYAFSVWNLGYVGNTRQLESVQRRWAKAMHGLEDLDYSHRLQTLNSTNSVKGRLIRHNLIKYWQIFHDEVQISCDEVFPRPLLK